MTNQDEPEKVDLRSFDIVEEKRQELLRLFPEVRTEGPKIHFDRLKETLGETVDVGKERYGLTWPGKANCSRIIQQPSLGTLRPAPEESVEFDTTENLIIEGDNLEVLKLLQKSYLGKVKMIYIDPPYNTGNDFIYPDDYSETLQTYLEYTGQADADGRKFGTNTDTDGRFHSKWLNMMYPRPYLARNLLRDDGLLFVTINDQEHSNLRTLLNEIFGEESFVGTAVWEKAYTANMTAQFISDTHDYVVIYSRNPESASLGRFERSDEAKAKFTNPDNDPRGPWKAENLSAGKYYGAGQFQITGPTGLTFSPPPGRYWRCNEDQYQTWLADGRITFGRENTGRPMLKKFLAEVREGLTPSTWWEHEQFGTNKDASLELKALFPGDAFSVTPKPVLLLRRMIDLGTDPQSESESVILDFFAGSGTTGHAVLEANQQDGANRKFILVQLPEPTGRIDYPTIADLTKERVRRVIRNLNAGDENKLGLDDAKAQDRGFRVFKLAESNFKSWQAEAPSDADKLGQQLELHVNHIREARTDQDLLFEILLKSGYPLTTPVEAIGLAGKSVHSASSGALFICLERELSLDLVRAMADRKPERVVFLDEGFAGNDQLKANAVQIFKTKGVTSFKTV
jgi:adenine-specific DNA-methyltransferase